MNREEHDCLKGLSQIIPGARTASKNCYLSHIIFFVRAPGTICESPLRLRTPISTKQAQLCTQI